MLYIKINKMVVNAYFSKIAYIVLFFGISSVVALDHIKDSESYESAYGLLRLK